MKRSVVLLIIAMLCFNFGASKAADQLQDSDVNDCNCVCATMPEVYLCEDFNEVFVLNWDILGEDPLYWSLDTVPGALTITTQDDAFERSGTDYKNVFLMDFPITQSQDFQVTTCISNFFPYGLWNQAGLLLWNDDDNYLKLSYEYGQGPSAINPEKLLFTIEQEIDGLPSFGWFEADQDFLMTWLRIIKRGDLYEFYKSTDGETFVPMTVMQPARLVDDNTLACLDVPINSIGLFANNGGRLNAPQVDASFEYIEFKILPQETIPDPSSEED